MDDVVIAAMRVRMLVRESYSLKDKRQILNSIKEKIRNKYNVSIAEVDEQENRQIIVLGLATVGNEVKFVLSVMETIAQALRVHPIAEFIDHQIEIV